MIELYNKIKDQREESYKVINFIRSNNPNDLLISEFESAGEGCAFAFSTGYAGTQTGNYRKILSGYFKNQLFYNPWSNIIFSMNENENIGNQLSNRKKIIFQSSYLTPDPENIIMDINEILGIKNSTYLKVLENKFKESVYEIYPGDKFKK